MWAAGGSGKRGSGVWVYVLWLPKHSNVQRRPLGNRRISSVVTARMSKDARQSKETTGQDKAGQGRAGQLRLLGTVHDKDEYA